eukprot:1151457-Pelagomonas_calceolata.AAC.7
MTQERLKEELLMRQNELEKIDTLEEKIKSELQQLAEKSEQIQKQTTEFADVSQGGAHKCKSQQGPLRAATGQAVCAGTTNIRAMPVEEMRTKAEANKARLEQQQVKLLQRKDMLRQIVGEKTVKYQAKKAQLQENAYQPRSIHALGGRMGCSKGGYANKGQIESKLDGCSKRRACNKH